MDASGQCALAGDRIRLAGGGDGGGWALEGGASAGRGEALVVDEDGFVGLHETLVAETGLAGDADRLVGALQVGGLPLHPLIVHVVVVLVPLTALALLLGAFWPSARRRLGSVTLLSAVALLVLVPVTVAAGRELKAVVGPLPDVLRHEALGNLLLPWVIAMAVVALVQWVWFRFGDRRMRRESPRTARLVGLVLAGAALVVAAGNVVLIVLIGDSGARAVWGPVVG